MAERPVFIPALDESGFVEIRSFSLVWAAGFAVSQKRKNIKALHEAAARPDTRRCWKSRQNRTRKWGGR